MSLTGRNERERSLRILTIDNGGLQAMSVLRILRDVCEALSESDGHSVRKAPFELFDVIAGIGTGGWLAILLGRYKLDIDECMGVYINVANAINPHRKQSGSTAFSEVPAAISQTRLISKIDRIIADHGLGQHMLDQDEYTDSTTDTEHRRCHAFAVGMIQRIPGDAMPEYRLFRAYGSPISNYGREGPDPTKCNVSLVCAATAAARDFLPACKVEGLQYWDDRFPQTHRISGMAIDEADAIFGKDRPLDFLLNISPGIPSAKQIGALRKAAQIHCKTRYRVKYRLKRIFSNDNSPNLYRVDSNPQTHHIPSPAGDRAMELLRSNTWASNSSTSSNATQAEKENQEAIKSHMADLYGNDDMYYRLALRERGDDELYHNDIPYLDDIEKLDHSMAVTDKFLKLEETQNKIREIARGRSNLRRRGEEAGMVRDTSAPSVPGSVRAGCSLDMEMGCQEGNFLQTLRV